MRKYASRRGSAQRFAPDGVPGATAQTPRKLKATLTRLDVSPRKI
jgi:hypothetical protein